MMMVFAKSLFVCPSIFAEILLVQARRLIATQVMIGDKLEAGRFSERNSRTGMKVH
jgi:hypothetical protein